MKRFPLMLFSCLPLLAPALSAADAAPAAEADPSAVWDLTPLFADEAAWRASKERVAAGIPKIRQFKGKLGESASSLLAAMTTMQQLRDEFVRVAVYASLVLDENTRDAAALERTQEVGLLGTEFSRATSFIDPELLTVGEKRIRKFLDTEPGLKPFRFTLLEIVRAAPHTLGAEAEGVLSAAGLVTGTAGSLYGILANADMPWPTIKLSDGTEARLDQSGYAKWRASANRADRQAVFEAFWKKVREYERTFGVALFSQMKTDWFNASVRKYPSTLAAALDADNIPEAVYRQLLTQTNANLPTLHRYFKLRARMLGISDLRYWDIYPPLVSLDKKFPLSSSKDLANAAVKPLGADYQKLFADSLAGRYTHYYPRPGKRSGAYMSGGVHSAHAYVLMNYNDDYESLSTLVHEWGHGVHSLLANAAQPSTDARYSIFTAEIASTQNEVLLLDHMLKVAQSDDERLYYLGSALENMRGTFFRQAMFAEFELAIHETVEKGGSLSGQKFSQIYGDILRRYHGDAEGVLKIDDMVTAEWAYIPHFYRRFYVYQYATSIAAGTAFADRILAGEPGVVDTYLNMLKAGGSDHPYDLVKRAGVDLASPAPYQALIARMNRIMDQIEEILARKQQ